MQQFASAYGITSATSGSLVLSRQPSGCFSKGGPRLVQAGQARGAADAAHEFQKELWNSLREVGRRDTIQTPALVERVVQPLKNREVPVVLVQRLVDAEKTNYAGLTEMWSLARYLSDGRLPVPVNVEAPVPALERARDSKDVCLAQPASNAKSPAAAAARLPTQMVTRTLADGPRQATPGAPHLSRAAVASDSGPVRIHSPDIAKLDALKDPPVVVHTPPRAAAAAASAAPGSAKTPAFAPRDGKQAAGKPDITPARAELEAGYRGRHSALQANRAKQAAVSSFLSLVEHRVGALDTLSPEQRTSKLDVAVRQLAMTPEAALEDSAQVYHLFQLHFGSGSRG
ncbi:hypothetical protein JI739_03805 [Ramlibacter sp. AW1]|uniref:Uncharacterized protein n=1 Tax=Ramlibacter aurantiacus TaxID=2801330 RepID=A0A937D3L2_9BURK|nr:hypothetical protein [Ramlibacter aurantiacus]MBL0419467.1 hypothetical protein [Ramlibacter aurantiacus]